MAKRDLTLALLLDNEGLTVPVNTDISLDGSTLFVDGSTDRVGIGTQTPSQLLNLYTTGSDLQLFIEKSNSYQARFGVNSSNVGYIGSWNATPFEIQTNGTSRLRADTSGNIGIGTTSPGNLLHVDVNTAGAGTDSISVANRGVTTNGHSVGLRFQLNTAVPAAIRGTVTNVTNGASRLGFWTSSNGSVGNLTERMTVLADGNVGIGTTSPSEKLSVVPDTDASAEIGRAHIGYVGGNDYAGFSHVDQNALGSYALLQSSGGTTYLNAATGQSIRFSINNAHKMSVDSSGYLGIGTPNPGTILHIASSAPTITLGDTDVSTQATISGNSGYITLDSHTGQTIRFSIGSSEQARFTTTGLGIGTSSPTQKLTVVGGNGDQFTLDNTGQSLTQAYWNINGASKGAIWAGSDNFSIYGYSGVETKLYSNATLALTIDTSQNATFAGTLAAGATTVSTADGANALHVKHTGVVADGQAGTYINLYGPYTSGGATTTLASIIGYKENAIDGNYNGAMQFKVRQNGGTTNDRTFLTALGSDLSATFAGQVILPNNTAYVAKDTGGANRGILYLNSSNNLYLRNPSGGSTYIENTNTTPIVFNTNSTERMRIDGSGNVGIGTTSPTSLLSVVQSAGTLPSGCTNGIVLQNNNTTSLNAHLTLIGGNLGDSRIEFGDDGDRDIGMIRYVHNGNYMSFVTNTTEAMRITSDNKISIGASPTTTTNQTSLFVQDGFIGLIVGADSSLKTLTNATNKAARIAVPHYTNAEEPTAVILASNLSGESILNIGGGSSVMNAATSLQFWTAANSTTVTGSERMRINSSGQILIGTTSAPASTNTKLRVHVPINTSSANAIEISQNTTGANKPAAALGLAIANGGESTNAADLRFFTASAGSLALALTLNSSQNATFANNVYTQGSGAGLGTTTVNVGSFGNFDTIATIGGQSANLSAPSVLEIAGTAADADNTLTSVIEFNSINSGGRIAGIYGNTDGTTATNRGGELQFLTKADGGALATALTLGQDKAATFAGNVGIGQSADATVPLVIGSGPWPVTSASKQTSRAALLSNQSNDSAQFFVVDMHNTAAANKFGSIYLGARRTTGATDANLTAIIGRKTGGTGVNGSQLEFLTQPSGGALTTTLTLNSSQTGIFAKSITLGGNALDSWGTSFNVAEMGPFGNVFANATASGMHLASNVYHDGTNWKYRGTYSAEMFRAGDGEFTFQTAASGTADTNITWVERVVIDGAGNLGLTNVSYINRYGTTNSFLGISGGSTNTLGSNIFLYGESHASAGLIQFRSGTAERMRIHTNGNVGIGTTSPDELLHIESATNTRFRIETTNAGAVPEIQLYNAAKEWKIGVETSTDSGGGAYANVGASGFVIKNATDGVNGLVLDTSGNATFAGEYVLLKQGAGTLPSSTNNGFIVQHNANVGDNAHLTLIGGNLGDSRIEFGDDGDRDIGMIRYVHNGNYMYFSTNATERMRIDSSGKVGIGTTAPAAGLLDVRRSNTAPNSGQVWNSPNISIKDTGGYTTRGGGTLLFEGAYHSNGSMSSYGWIRGYKTNTTSGDAAGGLTFTTRNGPFYFSNDVNGTSDGSVGRLMTIEANGNVGIGVTSPATTLDIAGGSRSGTNTAEVPTALYVTGTGSDAAYTGIAHFRHGNQSQGVAITYQGIRASGFNVNQHLQLSSRGSNDIILNTGSTDTSFGSERMRIASSGNVGIGTSSPSARLQTNSTDGTIAIFRTTSGANNGRLNIDVSDAAATAGFSIGGASSFPAMTFSNGGSERMRITSGGYVSIGSPPNSSPDGWLHIDKNTAGGWPIVLESGTASKKHALNVTDDGALQFYDLTATSERMRILTGGGLTFNGDTATANALDDYEEGTFTATLIGTTTNPTSTVTASPANYVKIGNWVHCEIFFSNVSNAGASGGLRVSGLPFSPSNGSVCTGAVMIHLMASTGTTNIAPYISGTTVTFYQTFNQGGWSEISHFAGTGRYLYCSVSYKTT